MRVSISLAMATAIFLASCASHSPVKDSLAKKDNLGSSSDGIVKDISIIPANGSQYPEIPGATYLKIVPAPENAMPIYPEQLLAKRMPPVAIAVTTVVNANGSVESAEIEGSDGEDPLFEQATLTAIRAWHFTPLRRVRAGKTELLPTTEHFIFIFSQINGKAVVTPGEM